MEKDKKKKKGCNSVTLHVSSWSYGGASCRWHGLIDTASFGFVQML